MTLIVQPVDAAPAARLLATDRRAAAAEKGGFFESALADSPWRVNDLVRYATRTSLGLAGIIVSYAIGADSVSWRTQVICVAAGAGSAAVAAFAGVLWILAGLGNVSRERREVMRLIRIRIALRGGPAAAGAPSGSVEQLVASAQMRRYHRSSCDIVRSKPVSPVTARQIASRDLRPCGMCQP
jgi:uncharacterized membrane protein YcjF (UPF0283 family)